VEQSDDISNTAVQQDVGNMRQWIGVPETIVIAVL
jgi:hypothetical protein